MNDKKFLWFDTETTGLDPEKNDIIQIACLMEIGGEIVDKFHTRIQPTNYNNISPDALEKNNTKMEDLQTFPPWDVAYQNIVKWLSGYIDKYNKFDKLMSAGQNVKFDIEFLRQFFIKNNDKYFGSFFDYHFLDLQSTTALLDQRGLINVPNYKLETVAKAVGVELNNAHDAMADIEATRNVYLKYEEIIFGAAE